IAELDRPLTLSAAASLPTSAKAYRTVADANARRTARAKQAQQQAKKQQMASASSDQAQAQPEGQAQGYAQEKDAAEMAAKQAADAIPDPGRPIYLQEAKLRTEAALAADIGFAERLVWFWSNHFCISANKIQSMSGAYEREAVRANALGRFVDLLQAVESHPAMLFYLDNLESMGANSTAGINRNRGLHENIAREIMELHTLGVRTGYSQDDVIGFANVMTGWTLVPPGADPQHGGEFTFNPRLHEPGGQTVLGKRYEQDDAEQGRAVLRDLAAHPATATHVATKLARHFVADEPPPALVEQMVKTFRDTEGDLKQVAIAMVSSDEAWRAPPSKLKRPGEWVVGMVRTTGITQVDPVRFTGGQELLGEPLWRPSAPKGYPDDEASWIDGVGRRLDVANNFAERISGMSDPQAIIEDVFASQITSEVKQAVGRAESRQQALALLFMSADFQRR
ncbi:DUF1800 family protein, partial [Bradyrhizobium sp. SHOUNA76]|uniref:DUF1800 domain-containing protein n=3 Tax=unclassified Bradyrhizobium TaxID=2631580 RepID=UPI001FF3464A